MRSSHFVPLALTLAVSLAAHAEDVTSKLKINGFATAGGSVMSDDFDGVYLAQQGSSIGVSEKANYNFDTVLGVRLSYQVDADTEVVGQLMSVGAESFNTRSDWAYIARRLTDSSKVRVGRIALPVFMYSETYFVGQSHPWARLPADLYASVGASYLDGADLLYNLPLGDWTLSTQAYLGGSTFDSTGSNPVSVTVEETFGGNVSISNDALTLRLGAGNGKLTFATDAPAPPVDGIKASHVVAGVLYDDGGWFFAGEYGLQKKGGWLPDVEAGFVSVGHSFGKWLPYVLVSRTNTLDEGECGPEANASFVPFFIQNLAYLDTLYGPGTAAAAGAGAAAGFCAAQERKQTTYALGARYAFSRQVSLKMQVDHLDDFDGTMGLFQSSSLTKPMLSPDSAQVFSVNLNVVF